MGGWVGLYWSVDSHLVHFLQVQIVVLYFLFLLVEIEDLKCQMSQVLIVEWGRPDYPQEFHQDQGESHLWNLHGIIIFFKKRGDFVFL